MNILLLSHFFGSLLFSWIHNCEVTLSAFGYRSRLSEAHSNLSGLSA